MASTAFRPALDLMAQYASYHRDQRNIATHFVGIPLIVFALGVLLSRLSLSLPGGWTFTPAGLTWIASTLWYLTRGNWVLGLTTSLLNGLLFALAEPLAAGSAGAWLAWGLGLFALGWVLQFIGHYYEGKKPAFVDDLVGLLVGPMFVVGEALFALGWGRELLGEIERRVGPTHLRDLARPLA
ncbi:putative membrane protein YGL010W [Paucibacter oligotrophus]|uniref:Putative membrane protein YGL010W n=1 Tax=Roseateles oligotrophus TaxID=1769250 RepID=A0A840L290_9BURK|nr:Mpo1-like protein [Roseateles oligotrophus]MBB4842026.1 putative membrane protein YGL010W [Roseateles oligotrophus]